MAKAAGKEGSMTYSGITVAIRNWTLDWTGDALETTDFASAGWREYMGGLKEWKATAEGFEDSTNTADVLDSATLTLTVTSGVAYSGTALIVGKSPGTSVEGLAMVTYTFTGTGALTPPS